VVECTLEEFPELLRKKTYSIFGDKFKSNRNEVFSNTNFFNCGYPRFFFCGEKNIVNTKKA
jgi:hypothetical protein